MLTASTADSVCWDQKFLRCPDVFCWWGRRFSDGFRGNPTCRQKGGAAGTSRNSKASVDFIEGSYASQRHCREFGSVDRNNWLYWHCDEVLYVLQKWLMSRLKSRMRQIPKTGREEFPRGRVEKAIKQLSHAQTKISPESAIDGIISLYCTNG